MRTFCCCIPVRLGVLVLSPVTAVVAALLAYTQLFLLIHQQARYDTFEKAIRGALVGITILLALSSLFGFVGSVIARRRMVSFYSNILWISLLIFTVLGAIDLWQLFSHRNRAAQSCEAKVQQSTQDLPQGFFGISFDASTDEACKKLADISAIVVAILFGILVLVLIWLIGIVTKYKHQLQQRDAAHNGYHHVGSPTRRSHMFGNIGKSYQPAETREVDESGAGLLHTATQPAGSKDVSNDRAIRQQV